MEENYLNILRQSLEKKIQILEEIFHENQKQKEILQEESLDADRFESTIEKKENLIQEIAFLDDGFEQMYQRVKSILEKNRENFREEIANIQQLVRKIAELTLTIQAQEQENKRLASVQFGNEKKKVHQVKANKSAVSKYYKNMAKLNVVEPQFMDKKK